MLLFRGNSFRCNICDSDLKGFIANETDLICPNCGSLPRTRRLWQLIDNEVADQEVKLLDFSPSRGLYRLLKNHPKINYLSSDLSDDFIADRAYDLTNVPEPDNSYDLILCYHVLEHIVEDQKAMSELFRITKKGGKCFIQTPFKTGETYEDFSIVNPADRLKAFGQEDHVRIYSSAELKNRLEKAGFEVNLITFHEENENRFGLKQKEEVLLCTKPV